MVGPDEWGNRVRVIEVGPEDPRGVRIELRMETLRRPEDEWRPSGTVRMPPALLAEALAWFSRSGLSGLAGEGSSEQEEEGDG